MIFVDLSSNNPHPIGWNMLKGAGVGGVIVKATEGTGYVSPTFGSDYSAALAAGLVPGAYHFWHPQDDDAAQLAWFTRHYSPRRGDLPACWDAEVNPSGVPWDTLAARLRNIMAELVTRYGDAWLYVNRSWVGALAPHGFSWGHGVWLAQGSTGPLVGAEAMQFAPAPIPGVGGSVDWSVTDWRPPG